MTDWNPEFPHLYHLFIFGLVCKSLVMWMAGVDLALFTVSICENIRHRSRKGKSRA